MTLAGAPTEWDTCPILFGEPGTNAQHSFMQLVHQGTRPVPVDFILAANPDHDRADAHRALAASAFAQAEALLRGLPQAEIRAEMTAKGASPAEIDAVAPHRVCVGERPSNTILFGHLDAFKLKGLATGRAIRKKGGGEGLQRGKRGANLVYGEISHVAL